MTSLFKLLERAPKTIKEMCEFMKKNNAIIKYSFDQSGKISIVHVKYDSSTSHQYIVANVSPKIKLLYTGRSVEAGPNNISHKKDESKKGKYREMKLGSIQGLYYNNGLWTLCNDRAYDCSNLQWISPEPIGDIVTKYIKDLPLNENVAYTILVSTHENNIYTEDDQVYFLDAVATSPFETYEIFDRVSLDNLPQLPVIEDEPVEINKQLSQSNINKLFAHEKYLFGVMEILADHFETHMTDLGQIIMSIIFNPGIKMIDLKKPNNRYDYILFKVICGISREEEILKILTSRHTKKLEQFNDIISQAADRIENYNTSKLIQIHRADPVIKLFLEKYSEQLNIYTNIDRLTIKDYLRHPDFIPLFSSS